MMRTTTTRTKNNNNKTQQKKITYKLRISCNVTKAILRMLYTQYYIRLYFITWTWYIIVLFDIRIGRLCLIRMRENTFIYTQHVRCEHINGLWTKIAFALSHFHVKFHGIFAIVAAVVVVARFHFSFDSQFLSALLFLLSDTRFFFTSFAASLFHRWWLLLACHFNDFTHMFDH